MYSGLCLHLGMTLGSPLQMVPTLLTSAVAALTMHRTSPPSPPSPPPCMDKCRPHRLLKCQAGDPSTLCGNICGQPTARAHSHSSHGNLGSLCRIHSCLPRPPSTRRVLLTTATAAPPPSPQPLPSTAVEAAALTTTT